MDPALPIIPASSSTVRMHTRQAAELFRPICGRRIRSSKEPCEGSEPVLDFVAGIVIRAGIHEFSSQGYLAMLLDRGHADLIINCIVCFVT